MSRCYYYKIMTVKGNTYLEEYVCLLSKLSMNIHLFNLLYILLSFSSFLPFS